MEFPIKTCSWPPAPLGDYKSLKGKRTIWPGTLPELACGRPRVTSWPIPAPHSPDIVRGGRGGPAPNLVPRTSYPIPHTWSDHPTVRPSDRPTIRPSNHRPTIRPADHRPTIRLSDDRPTIVRPSDHPTIRPSSDHPTIVRPSDHPTIQPSSDHRPTIV